MGELAKKLDLTLRDIVLSAENHFEILIGDCHSGARLSNTQEHILMMIKQQSATSSEIAKALGISQAAVTKAVRSMLAQELLVASRDQSDARVVHYELSDFARDVAAEHAQHHEETVAAYDKLLDNFSDSEQAVISDFLSRLTEVLK